MAYSVEYWLRGDFPYGKKLTPICKRLTGRHNLLITRGLRQNNPPRLPRPRRLAPARLLRRGVFWSDRAGPDSPGLTGLALPDCLATLFLAYFNACIPMSMYIPMYSYTTYRRYLAIFILFHRKVL